MDAEAFDALIDEPISWQAKGFPLDGRFTSIRDLRAARPSLIEGGFGTPIATIAQGPLQRNLARMARYCRESSVRLAPHGKTTMAPALFAMQLEHGAWGITVATPWQARVCIAFGVENIFLANQLVEPQAVEWAAGHLTDRNGTFLSYVDSVAQIRMVNDTLTGREGSVKPFDVLVEIGYSGGRTGCRDDTDVESVVAAVAESPFHRLVGVAGYEGLLGHEPLDDVLRRATEYLTRVRSVTDSLAMAGAFPADQDVIVSAGGSAFFDIVAEVLSGDLSDGSATEVIVRSGGYLTHDDKLYGAVSPFHRRQLLGVAGEELEQCLEVWATVLSRPEPTLALLDCGKRDVPTDAALPRPIRVHRNGMTSHVGTADWEVVGTNDQHAYLQLPADALLQAGDRVGMRVSHPCTLFDKWTWIPLVDDDGHVVDAVRTFF